MLDISHNKITKIPAGLFNGLDSLTELHMWGNQISELNLGIFLDLQSLTNLNLNTNRITEIPTGLFDGLFWSGLV
jgi:Leucine-rich repeat (LRR) protein